jgi:hypothetical protein
MRRLNQFLLFATVILLGVRLLWMYVIPAWNTIVTDFPNYYVSAWAVRHGHDLSQLYDPVWFEAEKHRAGIERPAALFNYFPPMNALIMWPVAQLPPLAAKRVWTIVNLVALAAVIGLTAKASGLGLLPATAVAFLGLDALGNNLAYGQFYIVLTLLMLIAILAAERLPFVSSVASSVGTLTKMFPAIQLVYFIGRKQYRALILSAAAVGVLVAIGILALGWAPHQVYLHEVLGRTLRGEIQDPYNVRWNTLQALLRRALVREETLNPWPIADAAWLFFFLRPAFSLAIVGVTLFSIFRARRPNTLTEYGAMIAMVSLITPSQAGYHQFLFYPAVATGISRAKHRSTAFLLAGAFALICSNVMGATARFDSGPAMVLAFPRVYLVLALWIYFLLSLKPRRPAITPRLIFGIFSVFVIVLGIAYIENKRWAADVADGAELVPMTSSSILQLHPRFEDGRLITTSLGPDGLINLKQDPDAPAVSPDGLWTAFATNARGNWDIALRSNRTGEVRFLTTSSANDLAPAFSPDARWVYFASDRHRGYRFTGIFRVATNLSNDVKGAR